VVSIIEESRRSTTEVSPSLLGKTAKETVFHIEQKVSDHEAVLSSSSSRAVLKDADDDDSDISLDIIVYLFIET